MKLGKRDGIGHREVNKPPSPKPNLLCTSDHNTQDSTAPCPTEREKERTWGSPGKESQGAHQHTRRAWPSLLTPLSTLILTINPVGAKN